MSLASLPTIDSVTFARVRLGPDNLTELPLILIRRVDLNILCKFCSIMSHHVFTMFSPHVHCNFCWFLKVLFLIWLWLKMTPKMDGQILDISKNNQFCGSVGHWYHNLEPYIAILCHTVPGPYMVIPMFPHVPWQSSTLGLPDPVAHLRRRGRSGRSGARRGPGFGRWQGHEMGRPGGIGWVPNGIGSSKPIQST